MTLEEKLEIIENLIEAHETAIRDLQNVRNKIIFAMEKENKHE